jgi:hypothetical protein
MTRRYLPFLFVAAVTAALVLDPDGKVRPASRAIDDQPIVSRDETRNTEVATPSPVAPVVPAAAEAAFSSDAQGVETFRIKGPAEQRRSHDISDPIPVEVTGRGTRPDVVQIGEPSDADAPVAEASYAPEPVPIQIGRTLDANETDVWYLPDTSAGAIEIGTQLDTESPSPNQNQDREPVDIGPPIETEGLGTLL